MRKTNKSIISAAQIQSSTFIIQKSPGTGAYNPVQTCDTT